MYPLSTAKIGPIIRNISVKMEVTYCYSHIESRIRGYGLFIALWLP